MLRLAGVPPALSNDSATRLPLPLIIKTSELPLTQLGRATISPTIGPRSGVRCAAVLSPTMFHGGGVHTTLLIVRGRVVRSFTFVENGAALPERCAWIVRVVGSLFVSS